MIQIVSKSVVGKGFVKFELRDSLTKQIISEELYPAFEPNSPTELAKVVAAMCLAGNTQYAVSFIEWGIGTTGLNTSVPTNPDLASPLTVNGILTPVTAEPTANAGEMLFSSTLTDAYYGSDASIWEVGLRTSPIIGTGTALVPQYPKGMLMAYFQNSGPVPKTVGRVELGVKWLYIYTTP